MSIEQEKDKTSRLRSKEVVMLNPSITSGDEIELEGESSNTATTGSESNASKSLSIEENMNQLFRTLEPFVHKLDEQVAAVRQSQQLLYNELGHLLFIVNQMKQVPNQNKSLWFSDPDNKTHWTSELENRSTINKNNNNAVFVFPKRMFSNSEDDISIDIEEKSRRLLGLKRRLTLVHSILQTVNSRVKKLLLAHDSRMLQLQSKS